MVNWKRARGIADCDVTRDIWNFVAFSHFTKIARTILLHRVGFQGSCSHLIVYLAPLPCIGNLRVALYKPSFSICMVAIARFAPQLSNDQTRPPWSSVSRAYPPAIWNSSVPAATIAPSCFVNLP